MKHDKHADLFLCMCNCLLFSKIWIYLTAISVFKWMYDEWLLLYHIDYCFGLSVEPVLEFSIVLLLSCCFAVALSLPISHTPRRSRPTMSTNGTSERGCESEVRATNSTCSPDDLSVTASIVSMTGGILSNSLALFVLVKSYHRIRLKSKASFLLFASGLVVTDLLGHLVNGALVLFIHSSHKQWEAFDPDRVLCGFFGASLVFFGLSPLFLGCTMAVERCLGVTRPLFHSTAVAPRHVKRLLGSVWVLAALVAGLPLVLWRPYQVQHSRSWCFFREEEPRDWLDVLLPLVFSMLGLVALLLSLVCNTLTSCALLQSKMRRKHRCRGTSYHLEMIVQLLAIMLVSCVCWGPLLVSDTAPITIGCMRRV